MIYLKCRTVVVTGGAKGIGYGVVECALRSGTGVTLWDMDEIRAQHSRNALEQFGTVSSFTVDVQDEKSVAEVTVRTVDKFGSLDVVVNSVGITVKIQPM